MAVNARKLFCLRWLLRTLIPIIIGLVLFTVTGFMYLLFAYDPWDSPNRTSHITKRATHITGIFPTNIQRECSASLLPQDFEDCAHAVQWRNAKFGVVITIIGLGFIFTVGFTFMSCMRREKARRLTRFYDFTVASGTMSPISKKPNGGNDLETALTNNHESVVLANASQRDQQQGNPAADGTLQTLDGVNDGWTLWIYRKAGIVAPPPKPPPRVYTLPRHYGPRLPTLKLSRPSFSRVQAAGRLLSRR